MPPLKEKTCRRHKSLCPDTARHTPDTTPNLHKLQKTRDEGLKKFGKSDNTNKAYNGYLAAGKKWLKDLVEVEQRTGTGELYQISLDKLAVAFDKPPNQYSAVALELFMTSKCFGEKGCGKSTGEGIHGAFCQYWDRMDDQIYAGPYSYDKSSGVVRGCPARAPNVQDILKAIKTRANARGAAATRQHAEAITIEDMRGMMEWSESVCPNSWFDASWPSFEGSDGDLVIKTMNEHGLMRAFCATGFTLFTRNFETASLQVGDMEFNLHTPAPNFIPFFRVTLEERKGWQKQAGYEGPRSANTYEIYQQREREIDMYEHVLRWLAYLETRLGRPLEATDYIFPRIAVNGTINPKEHVSYDMIQSLLSEFTKKAGLTKTYTTHCFRRGGAQYRFMFAPSGKRWPLLVIRWWGGWAVGEHVDTLIKYLVDSLQKYETGHGDALCPVQKELDKSFMGEHTMLRPATREDSDEVKNLIASTSRRLEQTMTRLEGYLWDTAQMATVAATSIQPMRRPEPYYGNTPWSSIPYDNHRHQTYPSTKHIISSTIPSLKAVVPSSNRRPDQWRLLEPSNCFNGDAHTDILPYPNSNSNPNLNTNPNPNPNLNNAGPLPGVVIPNIVKGSAAWKDAIAQWETGGKGMSIPLKDWPTEWYTGDMRKITGAKRTQRQIIYDEYIRLGRDDTLFLQEYPEAKQGVRKLLEAIRKQGARRRRKSKNGTPFQRDSSEHDPSSDQVEEGGDEDDRFDQF